MVTDARGAAHAKAIAAAIAAAEADGFTVEIQSIGYPDPDMERIAVLRKGQPEEVAWTWRYDDD